MALAFAMPLCCCVVNGLSGGGCCGDTAAAPQVCLNDVDVQVPSCCEPKSCCSEQATPVNGPAPCDNAGTCTCCIKVPGPVFEWTVPVDHIGTLIVDLSADVTAVTDDAMTSPIGPPGLDDPPPPWQRIAAGCGCTILHC